MLVPPELSPELSLEVGTGRGAGSSTEAAQLSSSPTPWGLASDHGNSVQSGYKNGSILYIRKQTQRG